MLYKPVQWIKEYGLDDKHFIVVKLKEWRADYYQVSPGDYMVFDVEMGVEDLQEARQFND